MTPVTRGGRISRRFDRDSCTIGTIAERLRFLCRPPQTARPTPQQLLLTRLPLSPGLPAQHPFALLPLLLPLFLDLLLAPRPPPRPPLHPSRRRNSSPQC